MTLAELKDLVQIGVGLLTLVGGGFGLFKLGRTNASRHAEHAQARPPGEAAAVTGRHTSTRSLSCGTRSGSSR